MAITREHEGTGGGEDISWNSILQVIRVELRAKIQISHRAYSPQSGLPDLLSMKLAWPVFSIG